MSFDASAGGSGDPGESAKPWHVFVGQRFEEGPGVEGVIRVPDPFNEDQEARIPAPADLPSLQDRQAEAPPQFLYHYTAPQAFMEICRSGKVWASSTEFLNDTRELAHGFGVAKLYLENQLRRRSSIDDHLTQCLGAMWEHSQGGSAGSFTFSVSADGDVLSQWRAYCPPSGGYALGFLHEALRSAGEAQGFYVAKCLYKVGEQNALVADIVNFHLCRARADTPSPQDLAQDYFRTMRRFAPIIKQESFKEEQEWRLIHRAVPPPEVDYHAGRRSIVPHCSLTWRTSSDGTTPVRPGEYEPVLDVVVGPTIDPVNVQFATEDFLKKHVGPNFQVRISRSSYRGWG